jgi:phage repressor protein C with HTH and peptisase S24 domain
LQEKDKCPRRIRCFIGEIDMPRLTHDQVWDALDALAQRYGLSASGLAKRAGLDATSFNKSKRIAPDGHLRWPSTESVAKVLDATGATVDEFISLLSTGSGRPQQALPLIGYAQAGVGGFFDDGGYPAGSGWDEVNFPGIQDAQAYALEVTGDSMLPLYRDGDRLIVAPNESVRVGDRVVVKTLDGEIMAKELKRQTAKTVELRSLNPAHNDLALGTERIAWMARIVWASQ